MPERDPNLTKTGQRRCVGIKSDETRCEGFALRDSQYCIAHDPARSESVRQSRSRGGIRSRETLLHRRLRDLLDACPTESILLNALAKLNLKDPNEGKIQVLVIEGTKVAEGHGPRPCSSCGSRMNCCLVTARRLRDGCCIQGPQV